MKILTVLILSISILNVKSEETSTTTSTLNEETTPFSNIFLDSEDDTEATTTIEPNEIVTTTEVIVEEPVSASEILVESPVGAQTDDDSQDEIEQQQVGREYLVLVQLEVVVNLMVGQLVDPDPSLDHKLVAVGNLMGEL